MLPQYLAFHLESTGTVGFPLHDPSAAILLAKPELAAYERVEIAVEKRGELTRGALVIDDRPYPASFGRPSVWVGRPAATSFAEEFVSVAFGA
jgi:purine nucleosidase